MRSIKLKLFIIALMMLSCTFFLSIGETKAIYHEVQTTTISLSVVSGNGYSVRFNSNGGSSVATRIVEPNEQVGVLPIPTKSGYNFAGWYDTNNQRVYHTNVITADTDLHAVWTEIVCKRVTDENKLHTEVCLSGGCRVNNNAGLAVNDTITYGAVGDGVPVSGDAYDCDVNYDGTFDATESDNKTYTERFYFVREKTNTNTENNAVLVYSTSFDEHGRDARVTDKSDGSYHYTLAESYLPASTPTQSNSNAWDNPLLVDFDGNGKVSRFTSMTDLETVCGPVTFSNGNSGTSYFASCQKWFWFENSRFQNLNVGRAGIWLEYETGDTKYHRIHTQSFDVMEVEESSENMARPVIEIPMSALEGYYDEARFTLSFSTYNNDPDPLESVKRYRGEEIGTLPTPTRTQYTFVNWYTDPLLQDVVDPTALVSGNMTLYAGWQEIPVVSVYLELDGGTITGVTSPITLNSGEYLQNLPDPTKEGFIFQGWYTDDQFANAFDDTVPITADTHLYALWQARPIVIVTLHLDNGTISGITLDNNDSFTMYSGDLLDNLPDPTKTGYTFEGWYTDAQFGTQFDDTQAVTTNLDLYALWAVDNYVAEVNGTKYTSLDAAINAVPNGTSAPTTVKVLKDITLTSAAVVPNGKWVELDLQEYTLDTSTGDLIKNSGKLNIINGTLKSTFSGSNGDDRGYIIANSSTGVLNISGGLLKYDNTSATEGKVVKNKGGTINITGGRLECDAVAAAIDNGSRGTINMSGGAIVSTGASKGQAIYNEANSTVNISGDAYLENKSASSGSNARGAVDNNSGTIRITGGTIVSKNYAAVSSRNANATTYIGIEDSGGNVIDTTTPVLQGKQYAVVQTNGTVNVYDGVYMSGQTGASSGTVVIPTGTTFTQKGTASSDFGTLNVYYLEQISGGPYTVTFDTNGGNSIPPISGLQSLEAIADNNTMPNNPTKANYIFEKWFIYKEVNSTAYDAGEFTSTTPVADDITVMAKWKPAIGTATISPASISFNVNDTDTITVTGPDGMEAYSFSSGDTNVATVSQDGTVTAVGTGSTTITITGAESGDTVTINVTVGSAPTTCRVIFNTDGGPVIPDQNPTCGTALGANMPQDPTKSGYVFNGWIISGTSTSFNSTTPVTANPTTVVAQWIPSIELATISSSISVEEGSTATISMTNIPTGMEGYSVVSNGTAVATVNNLVVTGVAAGTTTISITGTESGYVHTVNVTVTAPTPTTCRVIFNTDGGPVIPDQNPTCGTSLGANMPQDPTKSGYVFNGWIISGTSTSFDSTTPVTANPTTVVAQWIPSIELATISSSISVEVGSTATISMTNIPTGMEGYSVVSNGTAVATVNNLVVTGVTAGTTTISITGTESGYVHTVNVTVTVSGQHNVYFMKESTDTVAYDTMTVNDNDILGELPDAPVKTGSVFAGWYTDGPIPVKVTEDVVITADVTYYAHWDKYVCMKATTLHSSSGTDFGTLPGNNAPSGGYAYDCDVNGDDDYTQNGDTTERFYYLTTDNNGISSLIFYNNTTQSDGNLSVVCGATAVAYGTSPFISGPTNASSLLPTTSQWTNVTLHSTPRQIYNELGGTTSNSNTLGTYDYSGKAARFATFDEIKAATTTSLNGTNDELLPYPFLLENTPSYTSGCRSNYWLETPLSSVSKIYRINGATSGTSHRGVGNADGNSGVRPVIEVLSRYIEGAPLMYSVSFDSQGGSTVSGRSVADGSQLGALPTNPTKTDMAFDGWYTAQSGGTLVTSTREIHNDVVFYAKWIPSITQATITPSNSIINLNINDTEQLTITPVSNMETYTIASSNSNIASFNSNNNTITGVNSGTTTVTITGDKSGDTITYTVIVSSQVSGNTIIFDPDNGGSITTHTGVSDGTVLSTLMPATPTKSGYVFDDWYLYDTVNDVLTSTTIVPSDLIAEDRTYKAKWAPSGTVCKVNGDYYTTPQDCADSISTNNSTTIYMLDDYSSNITGNQISVIDLYTNAKYSSEVIVLDLNGHTISYTNTSKVYVIRTKADLEIKNGTITSSAKGTAAVNAESGGKLRLYSGTITATGDRQGVYNDGGTIYVGGTVSINAKCSGAYNDVARGALTNYNGTMYITGGTITNTSGTAIAMGSGTMVIGTDDGTIDTTSLVATGNTYGLEVKTGSSVTINDGLFKGKTLGIKDTTVTTHPTGTAYDTDDVDGQYKLAYLYYNGPTPTPTVTPTPTPTATPVPSTYTITFHSEGGTITPATATINQGDPVASGDLPSTTTWGSKTFAGWYQDEDYTNAVVAGTTTPSSDVTYYAKWTQTPSGSITSFRTTNDAMVGYYSNISSWKNSSANFPTWTSTNTASAWAEDNPSTTPMFKNFVDNDCACYDGQCSSTNSGSTRCDLPKGYSTGVSGAVDVFLYDETTHVIGKKIDYAKATSGTIYNLVPDQAYYWEKQSDASVNGFIKFTSERRILNTGDVRNTRDLGGLPVVDSSNNVIGYLKYEKLYRGMKLVSSSSVTELTNLGINSELDLREANSDTNKLSRYDRKEAQNYYVIPYTTTSPAHTANSTEINYYEMTRQGVKYAMQEVVAGRNVFFHCRIGADRTGTVAYVLEGLLGVREEDRIQDYELSFFSGLVRIHRYHNQKPGSSVGTGYERFTYMHDLMPTNQNIYDWYMYYHDLHNSDQSTINADIQLINQFKAAMIDYTN